MKHIDIITIAATKMNIFEEMINYWKEKGYVTLGTIISDKSYSQRILYCQKLQKSK